MVSNKISGIVLDSKFYITKMRQVGRHLAVAYVRLKVLLRIFKEVLTSLFKFLNGAIEIIDYYLNYARLFLLKSLCLKM